MNHLLYLASSIVFHVSMILLTFGMVRLLTKFKQAGLNVVRWPLAYVVSGLIFRLGMESAYSLNFLTVELKEFAEVSAFLLTMLCLLVLYSLMTLLRSVGRVYTPLLKWFPAILISIPAVTTLAFSGQKSTIELFETGLYVFSYHIILAYMYGVLGRVAVKMGEGRVLFAYGASVVTGALAVVNLLSIMGFLTGTVQAEVYISQLANSYFALSALTIAMLLTFLLKRKISHPTTVGQKIQTGVTIVDEMLEAGLPYPSAIAFFGPAGSGRTTIVTKISLTRMLMGEGVVFLSVDMPSAKQAEIFVKLGADVQSLRDNRQLLIIDTSGREESLKLNPQEISIAFTNLLNKVEGVRKWVVIDSFTTLVEEFGQDTAMKLLRTLCQKARSLNAGFIFTFNPYAFSASTTALVEDCVDGVIELVMEETRAGISRKIRVKWMTGYGILGFWRNLEEIV
ncbi:MAG: RAD55 family ATPase [Candidatus Caldarchaeum sp.]